VIVKQASIERDLVSSADASYVRVAVTDHTRPVDEAVDRFIVAVRALPQNAWAHFHCEAGLGRTTTFIVLYDMLRNASRVSLEDIVQRQKLLGYFLRKGGQTRGPKTSTSVFCYATTHLGVLGAGGEGS
jgi:Inositol hexakisphosphate